MGNLLEDFVASLNSDLFLREFSFAMNNFRTEAGEEYEFADHAVCLDELLVIYQLKQRAAIEGTSPEREAAWFKSKVIGKAARQVRGSLAYLESHPQIRIRNARGHTFDLEGWCPDTVIKLVLYQPSPVLPATCRAVRFLFSRSAGFIHLLPWADYQLACNTLVTPAEIVQYFDFREGLINQWKERLLAVFPSEKALQGQFLSREVIIRPDGAASEYMPGEEWASYVDRLKDTADSYDISFLLKNLADHIVNPDEDPTDYYPILAEFAKLDRAELAEVKKRMVLCAEAVRNDEFMRPTRMIAYPTECGFVFMPIQREWFEHRVNYLHKITAAAKYDQHSVRQIGVLFAKDGEWVEIHWCMLDCPWKPNPIMEEALREDNLLRPLQGRVWLRYDFDG